jgi:hypothetical protein
MSDKARRKELQAHYKQIRPEGGIYRIINNANNKAFLGSTLDLAGVRKKLEFARSTNMTGVLDLRLREDIRTFGIDAFSLEVLEVLETTPEMTAEEIKRDLATLEELWREKLDPALLY